MLKLQSTQLCRPVLFRGSYSNKVGINHKFLTNIQNSTKESRAHFSVNTTNSFANNDFYVNRVLDNYTNKGLKKLSLRQLLFFGRNLSEERLLTSANYVRTELPVRLAHRIRDFQALPFKVGINPHVQETYQLYWAAFQTLKKLPKINNLQENREFCSTLDKLLKDHLVVISKLALGMAECSQYISPQRIDSFMEKALMSRIARRAVAEQHIALTKQFEHPEDLTEQEEMAVGIVTHDCDPKDSLTKCSSLAVDNVLNTYSALTGGQTLPSEVIPKMIIDGHQGIRFPFVQDHIEYVLFEVLKNSYKASINHFLSSGSDGPPTPPPIRITLAEGAEEVAIRVSDLGGGIPLPQVTSLFSFARSDPDRMSALESVHHLSTKIEVDPMPKVKCPSEGSISGSNTQFSDHCSTRLGMGLPVARIIMQYWGGSLSVTSLPGLGCDVYLRFPSSKSGAKEHLPFDPTSLEAFSHKQVLAKPVFK